MGCGEKDPVARRGSRLQPGCTKGSQKAASWNLYFSGERSRC